MHPQPLSSATPNIDKLERLLSTFGEVMVARYIGHDGKPFWSVSRSFGEGWTQAQGKTLAEAFEVEARDFAARQQPSTLPALEAAAA